MKKISKKLLAALLAVLMVAGLSATVAALDETRTDGILTVYLKAKADPDFDELVREVVPVELYKVADVDSAYNYTLLPDFDIATDVDLQRIPAYKDIKDATVLQTIADAAKKAVEDNSITPTRTENTETVGGAANFDNLEMGLYLVLIEPVTAGEHIYSFSPLLVSMPSMGRWDGTAFQQIVVGGEDTYAFPIAMKPEIDPAYGKLIVRKTVMTDSGSAAVIPCTFVFKIEATQIDETTGQPVSVYSDVVSLNFGTAGMKEREITDRIPLNSDVTVTEIYYGPGYKPQDPANYKCEVDSHDHKPVNSTTYTFHMGWQRDAAGKVKLEGNPPMPTMIDEYEAHFYNLRNDNIVKESSIENRFNQVVNGDQKYFDVKPISFNNAK